MKNMKPGDWVQYLTENAYNPVMRDIRLGILLEELPEPPRLGGPKWLVLQLGSLRAEPEELHLSDCSPANSHITYWDPAPKRINAIRILNAHGYQLQNDGTYAHPADENQQIQPALEPPGLDL